MRSQTLFSIGYSHWTMTGLAVLVFLVVTPAHAQVACKLLQPAELESALKEWALGGKTTKFSGESANSGGIALDTCSSEIVRSVGNLVVTVVIAKNLPMDAGDLIRINNGALARQKSKSGAQFEEKTVGNAICTRYVSGPAYTVCSIPRARGYVEVTVRVPTQKEMVSMNAVATLVQKAYTRW